MKHKSFNENDLLREFKVEEEILLDMIALFEDGLQGLILPIKEAIHKRDASKLKLNAHTIKGVLSNFYAEEVKNLAQELEKRGEDSAFEGALIILNEMENKIENLLSDLNNLKFELINKA